MKPFTLRNLLDRRAVGVVTVGGVEWVTDRYVMARADLFRTPPAAKGLLVDLKPAAVGKVLYAVHRAAPAELTDTRTLVESESNLVRLLADGATYLPINSRLAVEWLDRRPWSSITRRGIMVAFHELRRGRPVLAGLIMPVRLEQGRGDVLRMLETPS